MPIDESADPFEVIGEKPHDKAYQWIALTVLGMPVLFPYDDRRIYKGGWEEVPPARHPQMTCNGDRIEVGGCVLMERDAAVHAAVAAKEKAAATALMDGFTKCAGIERNSYVGPSGRGIHGTISAATTPQQIVEASESETVEVTIPLRLSPRLVTAASVCGLTPQEYARRAIIQTREGLLNYMLLPTEDSEAFELVDRLIVSRPDRGNAHG